LVPISTVDKKRAGSAGWVLLLYDAKVVAQIDLIANGDLLSLNPLDFTTGTRPSG
jgi:hypothetical protein